MLSFSVNFVGVVLFGLFFVTLAHATTLELFVSPNGANTSSCGLSAQNPCSSFFIAFSTASTFSNFDSLVIHAGPGLYGDPQNRGLVLSLLAKLLPQDLVNLTLSGDSIDRATVDCRYAGPFLTADTVDNVRVTGIRP